MHKVKLVLLISAIISLTWWLCIYLSKYFYFSKFYFSENHYESYLEKIKLYENSSKNAKENLDAWLRNDDRREKILFNKTNANFLCVGILSKKRINSNINYLRYL